MDSTRGEKCDPGLFRNVLPSCKFSTAEPQFSARTISNQSNGPNRSRSARQEAFGPLSAAARFSSD